MIAEGPGGEGGSCPSTQEEGGDKVMGNTAGGASPGLGTWAGTTTPGLSDNFGSQEPHCNLKGGDEVSLGWILGMGKMG